MGVHSAQEQVVVAVEDVLQIEGEWWLQQTAVSQGADEELACQRLELVVAVLALVHNIHGEVGGRHLDFWSGLRSWLALLGSALRPVACLAVSCWRFRVVVHRFVILDLYFCISVPNDFDYFNFELIF